MPSRYSLIPDIQPPRVIKKSPFDIPHVLKQGETLSSISSKYFKSPVLSWLIMYRNPEFANEFEIPFGTTIFIPWPLTSTLRSLGLSDESILR